MIREYNIYAPSFYWVVDMDFSQDYLNTLAHAARTVEQKEAYKTNLKATMSSWQIFNQTPVFNHFLETVDTLVAEKICPDGYTVSDPSVRLGTYEAWTGVYKKGDRAEGHWHASALLSYVFYIKADPERDSPLTIDGIRREDIPAQTNRLIVFPGTLGHMVREQTEDTERIIVAGNQHWMPN